MGSNEKERPAISGLDEIFASGKALAGASSDKERVADMPVQDTSPADAPSDDGRKHQSRRFEKNRRRNRRPKEQRQPFRQDAQDTAQPDLSDDAMHEIQDTAISEQSDAGEQNAAITVFTDMNTAAGDDCASESTDTQDTDADSVYTEITLTTSAPENVEVVGVRFKDTSKTYYFAPGDTTFRQGDHVIVETSRGTEYGSISVANTYVPVSAIVPPLRDVLRPATDEDTQRHEENLAKAKDAFTVCLGKIRDHGLEMKLIDAEYTFDQSKLTFYFSADGRVDFRDLVKDLASVFRTRIELRQIGIRDEAKLVGGLGVCGRPFCCSTFLSDFVQVSIKMAKEQNLSLNSAKISGACGRLMCCLRYEHDTYAEEIKKTPSVGSRVKTADGVGVVIESAPLRAKVKVKIGDEANHSIHEYDRGDVTVLPKNKADD